MAVNTNAARTTTDFGVMESCARSQDPDVRYSLTLNPAVSVEILSLLVEDPDPDVREGARNRVSGGSTEQDKYETRYEEKPTLFMTTTPDIPGTAITKTLGLISGSNSKMALGFNKQSERLDMALNNALLDMERQARVIGANAIVAIQIAANSSQGASAALMGSSEGIVVIGTAVIADLN